MGLAMLHQETLPNMRISLALCKLLLGSFPVSLEDLAPVDPAFYEGKILYLQESRYTKGSTPMKIEDLAMFFVDTPSPEVFPGVQFELCPGGALIQVTEKNKAHYLWLLCDHRLRGA